MRALVKKSTMVLLAAICTCYTTLPSLAQATILTGSVAKTVTRDKDLALLLPQRASAYTPAAATYVPGGVATYSQPVLVRPSAPPVVQRPRTVVRVVRVHDRRTFWQRHPKLKAAAIGAGVGAGAGSVVGLISGRGVFRGAAIGAGTGAGVGLVRSSRTMRRHPIIRDTATGALVGLGLGGAASRHGRTIGATTGVGAAVGLGIGLLRHGLR